MKTDPRIHLVLASASPRRRDLLSAIGIQFQVVPADIDERATANESPVAHVKRLALAKARQVSEKIPDLWVLGADTIVVKDKQILGKPRDKQEAKRMLSLLSNATHIVYTGYALVHAGQPERQKIRYVRSSVFIRRLAPKEIAAYVATGEPMDKAGAYAVQGIGAAIVETVSGSYTTVVGLPLCEVTRDLKELGIFDFLGPQAFT
jgi:septum formation protein